MQTSNLILPPLIELSKYNGDTGAYIEAVYQVFVRDFVIGRPLFRGTKLSLKKHPIENGKECTFYHITHTGQDEKTRIPDLRRMERIGYPRPMIDNSSDPALIVWENMRANKNRILIYHEQERYLVVLEKRSNYVLFWTAYLIEHDNRHEKLLREYLEYKKNRSRPN